MPRVETWRARVRGHRINPARDALDVLELEQALRLGLARDEFEPHFQPLVALRDRSVVGYEALIRWHHPRRGLLPPGEFMPVAEESGLQEAIDWRMYRLAMECARRMLQGEQYLSINVSPRMFQSDGFAHRLLSLVASVHFPRGRLRVEVTEGTLLADPDAVLQVLHQLRASGVEAALDDFGTGYSSLGQVHRYPLCAIKVDRSFVEPFGAPGASPRNTAVVEAIISAGGVQPGHSRLAVTRCVPLHSKPSRAVPMPRR